MVNLFELTPQFLTIIIVLLINQQICSSFKLDNCECGLANNEVETRIVGGEVAQEHIFPWIAAIYNGRNLHCGGALINNRYILTAGHCVKWVNYKDLSLYLATHDRRDSSPHYFFDKSILHKDFTSDFLHDTNDIALLRTKVPVRFTKNIQPICLPHPLSDYSGRKATVAGWGRVGVNDNPSYLLKKADVQVMTLSECNRTSIGPHLADTMMCAYAQNTDACQGDSGGPLVYARNGRKMEQIGVVSWGIGCASDGVPGVYTKVTDYLDWIHDNTQDATYCSIN